MVPSLSNLGALFPIGLAPTSWCAFRRLAHSSTWALSAKLARSFALALSSERGSLLVQGALHITWLALPFQALSASMAPLQWRSRMIMAHSPSTGALTEGGSLHDLGALKQGGSLSQLGALAKNGLAPEMWCSQGGWLRWFVLVRSHKLARSSIWALSISMTRFWTMAHTDYVARLIWRSPIKWLAPSTWRTFQVGLALSLCSSQPPKARLTGRVLSSSLARSRLSGAHTTVGSFRLFGALFVLDSLFHHGALTFVWLTLIIRCAHRIRFAR